MSLQAFSTDYKQKFETRHSMHEIHQIFTVKSCRYYGTGLRFRRRDWVLSKNLCSLYKMNFVYGLIISDDLMWSTYCITIPTDPGRGRPFLPPESRQWVPLPSLPKRIHSFISHLWQHENGCWMREYLQGGLRTKICTIIFYKKSILQKDGYCEFVTTLGTGHINHNMWRIVTRRWAMFESR